VRVDRQGLFFDRRNKVVSGNFNANLGRASNYNGIHSASVEVWLKPNGTVANNAYIIRRVSAFPTQFSIRFSNVGTVLFELNLAPVTITLAPTLIQN
jgi:hypothetical protein